MTKRLLGTLIIVTFLISGFVFAQLPEQPPATSEEPGELVGVPIDQLIQTVKATIPEGTLVSITADKGLFGKDKGTYTFKFDDGTEVQVDKQTGEILSTKEGQTPSEETLNLLSMVNISLEEAVKTVVSAYPENMFQSAKIEADETGNPVYTIELSDLTVKVNPSNGEIISPEGEVEMPQPTESMPSESGISTEESTPGTSTEESTPGEFEPPLNENF
ncbi:PepSY domain-containing protein [Petrotoga sp. DB-2]